MSIRFTRTLLAACFGSFLLALAPPVHAQGALLFEDHFDNGVWDPAWHGKLCCFKVVKGKVYEQDQDGWPRDAIAVVHDSDPSWTDLDVTLTANFARQTPFEHFNIVLHSDRFVRGSGVSGGTGYQLEFYGDKGWLPQEKHRITLTRSDQIIGVNTILVEQAWLPSGNPVGIHVVMQAGRIQLWVDGVQAFDVVDPNPLPFGGLGLHTIWESRSWYDDIVVRSASAE